MTAPELITFGCRLNTYESEVMRGHARDGGLENTVIVNTCAVTNEATRQARQAIRRARRKNPDAHIIVTGCAAQLEPERFADMPEVDRVLGNAEKLSAPNFLPHSDVAAEKAQVNDIMAVTEIAGHLIEGYSERSRAFVQIQNGCDHRCTFCIIPFARGNSRSVPLGDVVEQVQKLVENGYREIVLTGVDITAYGADLPGNMSLGSLVRRLLALVPELPRLRISSIDSVEIDQTFIAALAEEERLMPHLHLSLQAGDDMILKRMKRRHSRSEAVKFCKLARELRPDMAFGADIIAGFPTEDEAMFENSMKLIDDCDLAFLHIFPFSARPGTPAAKMPQLAGDIVKDRAARLRQKGAIALNNFLDRQVGRQTSVLVEKPGFARSENFAPVAFDGPARDGDILSMTITGRDGNILTGKSIS